MGRLPRDRSYAEKKFAIVMEGLKSGKVRRVGRARPEPRLSILGRSYVSVDVIAAEGARQILGKSCCRLLASGAAFPEILKSSAELAAAQGDDGVGALHSPVHARPLEPGPDYDLAASLHHAGRSAEALLVKLWISHAPSIFPDVVNTLSRLFVVVGVAAQPVHQRF